MGSPRRGSRRSSTAPSRQVGVVHLRNCGVGSQARDSRRTNHGETSFSAVRCPGCSSPWLRWSPQAVALAADPPRLELAQGSKIVLIGNALAERMQYFGHWETLLHSRFPQLELVVRNLGWTGRRIDGQASIAGFPESRPPARRPQAGRGDRRLRLQRIVRRLGGIGEIQERPGQLHPRDDHHPLQRKIASAIGAALADRPREPAAADVARRPKEQRKHQAVCRRHGRRGRQAPRGVRRPVHAQPAS